MCAARGAAERPQRADARRNRERLLEAAREVYAERGMDAQMDEIAGRAGVGVGTLYRHFTTKDALVGELVAAKLAAFAGRARRWHDEVEEPWEAFEGLVREQAEVIAADASQQRLMWMLTPEAMGYSTEARHELRSALTRLIKRAQDAGELRADFDIDDVRTLMCGLGNVMAAGSRGVAPHDWRRMLDMHLDGLRAR